MMKCEKVVPTSFCLNAYGLVLIFSLQLDGCSVDIM